MNDDDDDDYDNIWSYSTHVCTGEHKPFRPSSAIYLYGLKVFTENMAPTTRKRHSAALKCGSVVMQVSESE